MNEWFVLLLVSSLAFLHLLGFLWFCLYSERRRQYDRQLDAQFFFSLWQLFTQSAQGLVQQVQSELQEHFGKPGDEHLP